MKVIFLDIDGVANCRTTSQRHRGFIGIDPHMAFMIGKIQLDTQCEFVLSSAWRHSEDGREEVERQIAQMFDVTGPVLTGFRGDEIRAWLEKHPEVERYCCIDDNPDFYPDQNLFQTSWDIGMTEEIAKKITEFFNK